MKDEKDEPSDDGDEDKPLERKFKHPDFKPVEASGFLRTYGSVSEILLTNYEFQITFGEYDLHPVFRDPEQGEPEFIKKVTVSMAPEHVKRLHKFLGKKISDWEKAFGAEYRKQLNREVVPDPD